MGAAGGRGRSDGRAVNGVAIKGMSWSQFNDLPLTLRAMAAEIREVNIRLGWRAPDGGMCEGQTFGDYIALAHTELSEALEAYRDWRLEDRTGRVVSAHREVGLDDVPVKPLGVGSEFADLLIRLVDMADVFGIDLEAEYRRKIAYNRTREYQHGGRTLAGDKETKDA